MKDSIAEVNSIFEQPWWLDAVAPEQWGCIEIKNGEEIEARWPFFKTKRASFYLYGNPPLTQTLGPWIRQREGKRVKILSYYKKTLTNLVSFIPKRMNVDVHLDSNIKYVLPFRWLGFRYEPSFSYRFSNLDDLDGIFKGIEDSRKCQIRKAERELTITDDKSIDVLIQLQNKTYQRQNRKCPVAESTIRAIDKACLEHGARFLLVAEDKDKNIHAACYFVYDTNRCYYLMGGIDPDYSNSGATSLLLWEGIKRASKVSKAFDFEGSEIEDIERLFRSYGSEFVCYYRVYRLNFSLFLMDYLKPKIKNIIGYKQ